MNDLRAALLRYGAKHQWGCTSSTLGPDPRSECGLSDLLAATPEPTLDAERLANVYHRRRHNPKPGEPCAICRRDAGLIAAEYARLHKRTASQDAGTDE